MSDTSLDLKGLKCPLPALKTENALAMLKAGDRLTIECTDPLAAIDIPNLLRDTGDLLVASERKDGALTFRIEKR